MPKKEDPAQALLKVIAALEPLPDPEKQWVLQSAASRWALVPPMQGTSVAGGTTGAVVQQVVGGATDVHAALTSKNIRAFIRLKKPQYDVQRIACLAYFNLKTTGQQGFTSKEIQTLHTESGSPKINFTRALDNATRKSKYLSNRGPREKQLTTLGEDIVEALPSQEAVNAVEEAARHPRRGGRKPRKNPRKKA